MGTILFAMILSLRDRRGSFFRGWAQDPDANELKRGKADRHQEVWVARCSGVQASIAMCRLMATRLTILYSHGKESIFEKLMLVDIEPWGTVMTD